MAHEPFQTAQSQGTPTVRQQSIFIENRVGQLVRLTKLLDDIDIRILAVSVVYSVDCAICRLILDQPDEAAEGLASAGFQVSETELVVVSLPNEKRALLHTWTALLRGEISIHYTYPLLIQPKGRPALAVLPDNVEQAIHILREQQFEVLDHSDLFHTRYE
jgi:hypothetical protein